MDKELFAQILGIVVAITCVIGAQMKHKWQILLFSTAANLLNGLSFFFLGGAISGAVLCWVAVVQTLLVAFKSYKGLESTVAEKIIFLIIYIVVGVINIKGLLDILPCLGSVLFVLSTFCKKEQHLRMVSAASNSVWIAYDLAIMSTAVVAVTLSLISNLIALYRYRDKSKTKGDKV